MTELIGNTLIGISAAANVRGANEVAQREADADRSVMIVCVGCDGGDRYLSDALWEEGR